MKDQLFQIFKNQNKTTAVGCDMLVDFAYRALLAKFPEDVIAEAIGEHYRQCEEICLIKIKVAKEIIKKRKAFNKQEIKTGQNAIIKRKDDNFQVFAKWDGNVWVYESGIPIKTNSLESKEVDVIKYI